MLLPVVSDIRNCIDVPPTDPVVSTVAFPVPLVFSIAASMSAATSERRPAMFPPVAAAIPSVVASTSINVSLTRN